ncbi:hypothetical protein KR038_003621, partial [Drosophila bunnanda]
IAMEHTINTMSMKKFVFVTMLIWLLFLLIALPQWMIICLYSKNPLVYTLVLLFTGFILLACIYIFDVLRYKRPWNIICVLICYELLTIGISLFLSKWNLIYTLILIAVGIVFSGLLLFITYVLIINALYPNPIKIAVVGCMGFILVYCVRSVDLFSRWLFLRDVEVGIFLASVIIVMVCHILIVYENFALLRQDDAMHVAFVLHICYMLLMVGFRVATYCIRANVAYFDAKHRATRSTTSTASTAKP